MQSIAPIYTRPSVLMFLGYLLGSVAALSAPLGAYPYVLCMLIVTAVTFLRCRKGTLLSAFLVSVLGLTAGFALHARLIAREVYDRTSIEAISDGGSYYAVVEGKLLGFPRRTATGWNLVLEAGSTVGIKGQSFRMQTPVAVRFPARPDYELFAKAVPGDRVRANGRMSELPRARLGNEPSQYLRSQGSVIRLDGRGTVSLAPQSDSIRASFFRTTLQVAQGVENHVLSSMPRREGALLLAMTLGRTHHLAADQYRTYRRTGLLHLFSVSGLHTMLVGLLAVGFLRSMGLPTIYRLCVLALLLAFFASLVGLKSAVIRAALMLLLFESRELLRRPVEPLAALASVGLLMVILWPLSVYQVDFQLSFLCMVAITMTSPVAIFLRIRFGRLLGWGIPSQVAAAATQIFIVSCSIQLLLLPVLVGTWGEVSIIAPLANMLLIWVAGRCVLAGFCLYVLAAALPGISYLFLVLLSFPLYAIDQVAAFLAEPQIAVWRPESISLAVSALLILVILWSSWVRFKELHSPAPSPWRYTTGLLGIFLVVLLVPFRTASPRELEVTFLDIGQGDAILIRSPDGRYGLIDAGPPSSNWVLSQYLRDHRVTELDFILLTHADSDHYGGMQTALRETKVRLIYTNGSFSRHTEFQSINDEILRQRTPIRVLRRGDQIRLGSGALRMDVLHPTDAFVAGDEHRNDGSVVLLMHYTNRRLLLTGDVELSGEQDLLPLITEPIDVLKAGHHGAATSTGLPLLRATQPLYTVISCGVNNRYGHPAAPLMERLAISGTEVLRTDHDGSITVRIREDGDLSIYTKRRSEALTVLQE